MAKKWTRVRCILLTALLLGSLLSLSIGAFPVQAQTTYTVVNTLDSGPGSLRQAILDANTNPGADIIDFNIPGAGVQTITPASALPAITGPVTLDGLSQSDADCSSWPPTLRVELDGTSAGTNVDGLLISAGSSTVRGLVINRFGGDGIQVQSHGGNTFECNFLGTDAGGTVDQGNLGRGLFIRDEAGNTIGGTTVSARNLISGNDYQGVSITDPNATGNLIQGNYIGTNVQGDSALGNSWHGVYIWGAPNTTIGGMVAGARNVISGNENIGISIQGADATGNLVQGNYIGVDASGLAPLGNGGPAYSDVNIQDSASNNTIGGTAEGARNVIADSMWDGVRIWGANGNIVQGNYIGTDAAGSTTAGFGHPRCGVSVTNGNNNTIGGTSSGEPNLIANNTGHGVCVLSGTGNLISGNSIFDNDGLGIDLEDDHVPTANDLQDPDTGANLVQNYPVISFVAIAAGQTAIGGTLNSLPNTAFQLEFFYSSAADASGYGEGETYIGSATVNTDGSGDATFGVIFPLAVPEGDWVSATATDPNNNTSEFCASYEAPPPTAISLATFRASGQNGQVVVEWETTTEVDTVGFNLYRASSAQGELSQLNGVLIPGGNLGGLTGARYEYVDLTVQAGNTYYYWLEDVDIYGVASRYGPVSATPSGYRVYLPLVGR